MANTAYTVEPIELMDGTVFNLRPLPIKHQRQATKKLMDLFQQSEEELKDKTEEQSEDELLEVTAYCLNAMKKDWPENYDFTEVLDIDTVYKVLYVCTGIDLKKWAQTLEEMDQESLQKMVESQENGTTTSQS